VKTHKQRDEVFYYEGFGMLKMRFVLFLFILQLFFVLLPVKAFQLKPITMDFDPSGEGATRSFTVTNEGGDPIAVQMTITTRKVALNGEEVRDEVEDFIIYPAQLVLLPGEVQIIRVTWAGDSDPKKELAYRIIGEQLPIDLDEKAAIDESEGHFNILMRYIGAIYVVPPSVKAQLVVDTVEELKDEGGGNIIALTVQNIGTKHIMLNEYDITLKGKQNGERLILSKEHIPNLGQANMLTGIKRRFMIAWPEGFPKGPVEVELQKKR
jgi:fimbrial chaperone protein